MTRAVVSFSRFQSRSGDWSNQELAEFHRVAGILRRAGFAVDLDRGLTDEGDAWLVFCHPDTGEVVAHFARFDGQYVVAAPMLDRALKGARFSDLVDRFLDQCPIVHLDTAQRFSQRRSYAHPLAALTALIATLMVLSDMSKAHAEEEAGSHGRDADAAASLGPDAADLVRSVFYGDTRDETSAERREELRFGSLVQQRAEAVLGAVAIATAIAHDDATTHGLTESGADGPSVAELADGLAALDEHHVRGHDPSLRPASGGSLELARIPGLVQGDGGDASPAGAGLIPAVEIGAPVRPVGAVIVDSSPAHHHPTDGKLHSILAGPLDWIEAADQQQASASHNGVDGSHGVHGPSAAAAGVTGQASGPPAVASAIVADTTSGSTDFLSHLFTTIDELGIVLTKDTETGRRIEALAAPVPAPPAATGGGEASPEPAPSEEATGAAQGGIEEAPPADGGTVAQPPVDIDFSAFDVYTVMVLFARAADDGVGVYQAHGDLYMYELGALSDGGGDRIEAEELEPGNGLTIHLIGYADTFNEVLQALA